MQVSVVRFADHSEENLKHEVILIYYQLLFSRDGCVSPGLGRHNVVSALRARMSMPGSLRQIFSLTQAETLVEPHSYVVA